MTKHFTGEHRKRGSTVVRLPGLGFGAAASVLTPPPQAAA